MLAQSADGDVVGFVRFGDDPGDARNGHVYALYVLPSEHRRGVGRSLLDLALAELAARGQQTVTLWVFEANAPARGFYASAGFAPDGGRRVEPEYGAQEVRLRREVPAAAALRPAAQAQRPGGEAVASGVRRGRAPPPRPACA